MATEEQVPIPTEQQVFEFARAPEVPMEPPPQEAETPPSAAEAPPPSAEPPIADPAAVPSWRLREEAEARRVAEDRARELELRLAEITTHLRQQQPPKKPDFFESPETATEAILQRYITPFVEEQRKATMALGKMVAASVHGADKVDEAEKAFLEARRDQTLDTMDYERVVQAPNRYDAVVQWHKRQAVLSSVGDDPVAWFEKQLEARLADPKFQASLLEKVKTSSKPGPTKSVVELPPSLSRTTAAAGNGQEQIGDLSDASLFAQAMRR